MRDGVGGDAERHAVIFCGSGSTGAINRLVDVLNLRIPADLDERYGPAVADPAEPAAGRVHRPVRAPLQRAAVARVDRRRGHDPRGRATATSTWRSSRRSSARYADRPLKIGSLLGRLQRHRHRQRHARDLAPAPRARRAVVLGLRGRGAVRRRSRWTRARRPAAPTRTRSSSRPTSSSAGRARRACSSRAASCSATACPSVPGGGTVAVRQPDRARLPRPTSSTARRAARRRSSSRSAPGSCSSSRRRSASRRSASARSRLHPPRDRALGRESRRSRSWATTDAERLSIVSFVVRHDGRYLHHNFVVALLNDLFGIQSRGGCSCAGPVRPPAARHRPRDLARVRARDRARLRGHQARLGAGQLQLLHQRGRVRVHPRRGGPRRHATAGGCCPTTAFEPATGLWRHRGGPAGAAAEPARRPLRRTGGWTTRRTATASRSRGSPAYLDEARGDPGARRRRRAGDAIGRTRTRSAPTSRRCAGSCSPRRWRSRPIAHVAEARAGPGRPRASTSGTTEAKAALVGLDGRLSSGSDGPATRSTPAPTVGQSRIRVTGGAPSGPRPGDRRAGG